MGMEEGGEETASILREGNRGQRRVRGRGFPPRPEPKVPCPGLCLGGRSGFREGYGTKGLRQVWPRRIPR